MANADKTSDTITTLCVCSEEYCFCSESFEMPTAFFLSGGTARWQCTPCMQGDHVWAPGGRRDQSVTNGPRGVLEERPPADPHGYVILVEITLAIALTLFGLAIVYWLWP